MNNTLQENGLYCSFCGKSQKEVKKLIAGPNTFICDSCVDLCGIIISENISPAEIGSLMINEEDLKGYGKMPDTDEADPGTVLRVLAYCAMHWEDNARIIGNIRAVDITRAILQLNRVLTQLENHKAASVKKFVAALTPFADQPLTTEPAFHKTVPVDLKERDDQIEFARDLLKQFSTKEAADDGNAV